MRNGTLPEPIPTSANDVCALCGGPSRCENKGVISYDVPVGDPRFGKFFRCEYFPVEQDLERQDKLRKLSNLGAYVDKTFDNFRVDLNMIGEQSRQSLEIAYNVAQNFAEKPQGWLLLVGTYGCGKTHLAAAVGNIRLRYGDNVLFITTPDLLDHLRAAYAPTAETSYADLFERVRNVSLLILDDLGVEATKDWAQEKLFQLLDYRYNHKLPTVITTNSAIDALDPRVRSRLLHSDVVRRIIISAPDYRTSTQNESLQLTSNLLLYKDKQFENFDTRSNLSPDHRRSLETAFNIAYAYAKEPSGWLVLMGGYGSGKTHLAAAIANYQRENTDSADSVMFITVPDLLDYLRTTYDPNGRVSFDQRFQAVRNVGLLVLDDMGTENATAWAQEKLFQIIDHRYVAKLPTVITTSKELQENSDRLNSRLIDRRLCRIVTISAPSYGLRLRNK